MRIVYNRFSRVFVSTYRTSIKILHMSRRFFVHCKCKTLNGPDPDQATNYEYSLVQLAISYIRGKSLWLWAISYTKCWVVPVRSTTSLALWLARGSGSIQFLYLPKRLMWHRWHRGSRCICCGWFRLPACLAAIHGIPVLAVEEENGMGCCCCCSCKAIRRARWERAILALV